MSLANTSCILIALAGAVFETPDGTATSAAGGTKDWAAKLSGPAGTVSWLVAGDVLEAVDEGPGATLPPDPLLTGINTLPTSVIHPALLSQLNKFLSFLT